MDDVRAVLGCTAWRRGAKGWLLWARGAHARGGEAAREEARVRRDGSGQWVRGDGEEQ